MKKDFFHLKHGVIPACDVDTLDRFKAIIDATSRIEGIVGYKVGCMLAFLYGLKILVDTVKEYSDLPTIYDH